MNSSVVSGSIHSPSLAVCHGKNGMLSLHDIPQAINKCKLAIDAFVNNWNTAFVIALGCPHTR